MTEEWKPEIPKRTPTFMEILDNIENKAKAVVEDTAIYEQAKEDLVNKQMNRIKKYRPGVLTPKYKIPVVQEAYENLTQKEFWRFMDDWEAELRNEGRWNDFLNKYKLKSLTQLSDEWNAVQGAVESRMGERLNKTPLYGPRVEEGLKTKNQMIDDAFDVAFSNKFGVRSPFMEDSYGSNLRKKLVQPEPTRLDKVKNFLRDKKNKIGRWNNPYWDTPLQRFKDSPFALRAGHFYDKGSSAYRQMIPEGAVSDFVSGVGKYGKKAATTAGAIASSPFVAYPLMAYGALEYLKGSPTNVGHDEEVRRLQKSYPVRAKGLYSGPLSIGS